MPQFLQFFVLLPLLAFLVCLMLPKKNERLISGLVVFTNGLHLLGIVGFITGWLFSSLPVLDSKHMVLFRTKGIEIFIDFYFDATTAVFALVGSLLTLLVTVFSKFYLHREEGFKRFFSTLLLFFLGYNLVVFSGNFETLFMGWEILGICSFLLIAFYRDRYLPVKNGLKVISVYRLGDVCLILTMWMSHQLWHQNITFNQLNDSALVQRHLQDYPWYGFFICLMLFVAAASKSAQLPFSSWLPRAMEGPTTSTAVFYGSLSVHLGVFLLLRTFPYWESVSFVKILIIIMGAVTAVVAALIARVQSTVKTQIAYASVTQIGFMFIEVALGFHTLALIHFAANACLRTYQLLVSPSVLSYLIHDMVFSFQGKPGAAGTSGLQKIKNSIYLLSVKEWNLDTFQYRFFWSPFKWIGIGLGRIDNRVTAVVLLILFAFGVYADRVPSHIPGGLYALLPAVFAATALLLILRSFAERKSAGKAWIIVIVAQLFITLSIALFHPDFSDQYMLLYLGGSAICAIAGYICLMRMKAIDPQLDLNGFHGHVYEYRMPAFTFLICSLGVIGFPFTPTFLGIDILFSHIQKQETAMITFMALAFIFMELAVLRIYARVFLGQHKKAYHPVAYRSS